MLNRRRDRFIAWFNGPPMRGSRELLLKRTGFTKGRVSQLFDPEQPFGEKAAASLAERLGLPCDSFERDESRVQLSISDAPDAPALNSEDAALLDDLRQLLPEEQARWRDELHARAQYARRIRDWRPEDAPPDLSNVAQLGTDVPHAGKTGLMQTRAQKERRRQHSNPTRRKGSE